MLGLKSKNRKAEYSQGFTIMEIIVVIFIIALSLSGIMSLVVQNMQVEYINKNMLMASQLAQEGLELVRNVRDANWLSGTNWRTGDSPGTDVDITQDNHYSISWDYSGGAIKIYDADEINDSLTRLYMDNSGFYRHYSTPPANATSTAFSRLITVDSVTNSSTTISCIVQWRIRNNTHRYSAQTVLYDWR